MRLRCWIRHWQNFNQKEGLIPRSLLRNKLSEAGANPPLLAAGEFIKEQRDEERKSESKII